MRDENRILLSRKVRTISPADLYMISDIKNKPECPIVDKGNKANKIFNIFTYICMIALGFFILSKGV